MFEIIIIICLTLALFLLLRHYPEASSGKSFDVSSLKNYISGVSGKIKLPKRKKNIEAVKDAISRGQENVIAPIEVEEAKTIYSNVEPEIAELLYKAEECFCANDLREAEDKSLEAISKDKHCGEAYVIIGKIAFHRGQFDDAKEAFKAALKCNKELGEAYFGMGMIDVRDENISGAIEYLQKAVVFEKNHAEWYAELGKVYMLARQYARAAKVLKRASTLDIDSKEYRDLAAEAEEKQRSHSFYTRAK